MAITGRSRSTSAFWGISVEHFDPDAARRKALARGLIPIEEILVEHSTYHRGHLKDRLYAAGIKSRQCELCGQGEIWRGAALAPIIDHVNGVATDNRLENLRIVCPNCAATFATHCGRPTFDHPGWLSVRTAAKTSRPPIPAGSTARATAASEEATDLAAGRHRSAARVERPPCEQLLREVAETSWSAAGRKYGVSDNAVRKWMRYYERPTTDGAGL